MEIKKDLKVAIVHDFLVQWGGAEKVLEVISEMFPEAPIYTLLYDEEKMRGKFKGKRIVTSYIQKFPKFIRKRRRWLLPFFLVVPETWDFRDYDLVISSTGAWTKGIVTRTSTVHIAYMHSPMRFVWDYNERYLKDMNKKPGFFIRILTSYTRVWDKLAADRPDYLISNSKYTQRRIEKYYGRKSHVIYPPVAEGAHKEAVEKKNFFLVVSRLSAYKKVDLVVEAFNKLGLPLVVVGEGEQKKKLKKIAGSNVKIVGWKSDEELEKYYSNSRAFIFPSEDDFGMTMVEAMSFGVPVIAYRSGGALEIVREGISGEFFSAQTVEVLADGIRRFIENEDKYDIKEIKELANNFSKTRFKREILNFLKDNLK